MGCLQLAISDSDMGQLAADIDRQGYGTLPNCLSAAELQPLRAFAAQAIAQAGGEYVAFAGAERLEGTVLGELPESPAFHALCRGLYERSTGKAGPAPAFYQLFRCLQGQSGQGHSYRFHYDSYVLTVLIPIALPETGAAGDLLMLPNARPIRRYYVTNLLDKMLLDNRVTQFWLRTAHRRRKLAATRVRLRPGDMYFFWGYRSIHTNEACDPADLRATAVLHYADPHRDSALRTLIRRARRLREA
jgi:hypothetical protein